MISTTDVLSHANVLMRERYSESIRSRQIIVLCEAIVCKVNEELSKKPNKVAGATIAQQAKHKIKPKCQSCRNHVYERCTLNKNGCSNRRPV